MVCYRCIAAVKHLLNELKLQYISVQLGEVELEKKPSQRQMVKLEESLASIGFELLNDSKNKLIEKIKTIIIEQVQYGKGDEHYNLSYVLSSKLQKITRT